MSAKRSIGLVAAVVLVGACGRRAPAAYSDAPSRDSMLVTVTPEQRVRLRLLAAQPERFTPVVRVTGTVAFDGDQSTAVLAPISGPVTRVLVEPGARVTAGQPLAYVTSPDFAAALAGYRKAAAAWRNLKRIADLDSALYANDALARRDLDQARTDAVSAAADRDAALEQLRSLGVAPATLADLQADRPVGPIEAAIRAPLAGTVVERLVSPGQLIQAGTTLCFTVADLSRMWVMASVFQKDLPDVARGDPVDVDGAGGTLRGRVDNIAAEVDSTTRATAVRVVVPNPRGLLKKDMYVPVVIRARRPRSGILVPLSAVLRDEDNTPFVYVQADSLGFARRTVTLGERLDSSYVIASGVRPGDRVVAEGGLFLQFAQAQ